MLFMKGSKNVSWNPKKKFVREQKFNILGQKLQKTLSKTSLYKDNILKFNSFY